MTAVELVSLIVNGGILLGGGAGAVAYGYRRSAKRTSERPGPRSGAQPQAPAPTMSDSQRVEFPWTQKAVCDERHERTEQRLKGLEEKLDTACESLARIEGAMGTAPQVRRGGSAAR